MRAVIAVPPIRDFYFTPHRFSALGARVAHNILIKNGIASVLCKFPLARRRAHRLELPNEIAYLKPYILQNEVGKSSYFTKFQHFGPTFEQCASEIASLNPDLCFISVFAYCYAAEALELSQHIKQTMPSCTLVAAGAGVSVYPHYFLRYESVDCALAGEAETNLAAFLHQARRQSPDYSKVPGCFWKAGGTVCSSGPPQYAPPAQMTPSWAMPLVSRSTVHVSLCISRGCPKKCRFCTVRLSHGQAFRPLPRALLEQYVGSILIDSNDRKRRILFNFEDDSLLTDPSFMFEAMRLLKRRFPKCSFAMENGIDYSQLTEELVDRLAAAGMRQFNLSLASARPEVLESENRPLDSDHFERVLRRIAVFHGLPTITYFICGLKKDTVDSVASTLAYLAAQPTVVGISPFYALPGMDGFEDRSFFDPLHPRLCAGSSAYQWHPDGISTRSIVTAFRLSRYVNLRKAGSTQPFENEVIKKVLVQRRLFAAIRCRDEVKIEAVAEMDGNMVGKFADLLRS